jgi:hypothetical protein
VTIWRGHHPPQQSDGFWTALRRVLDRAKTPHVSLSPEDRAGLIQAACTALQNGHLWTVEALLEHSDGCGDAACLNLIGVIHEMRRQWKSAKRYYGRAIHADRHFDPAQQNMRRMYELETFGRTELPLATGDVFTDLCLARAHRRGNHS